MYVRDSDVELTTTGPLLGTLSPSDIVLQAWAAGLVNVLWICSYCSAHVLMNAPANLVTEAMQREYESRFRVRNPSEASKFSSCMIEKLC